MEERGEGLLTSNKQQQQQQVIKKGPWKPEEDLLLIRYVETHGEGRWATVSKRSGLMRGGKSCRLRWKNYLSPNLKRGGMSMEEEDLIIRMHKLLGNRWSLIAGRLPGRTDNEIKNYWNTHLRIKMQSEDIKEPKLKKRKLSHCQETQINSATVNESDQNNTTIMNRPPIDGQQQQQPSHHHHHHHHHQFLMSFEGKSTYEEMEEPYRNLVPLLDTGFFIESYGIEVMNGDYGKISSSYLTESLTYISEDLFQ